MSFRAGYISWVLVAILLAMVSYQYIGANKAEQKAQQLEAMAKDLDAQLKSFEQESVKREAAAQARYEASMQESANLRSILAKGSQAKPQNAPQKQLEAILAAPQPGKGVDSQAPAQATCSPFIYNGAPFVIEDFQVQVCDKTPVVQAEAAVALHEQKALVAKLNTELAESNARLALEDRDLAAYKVAEVQWKKTAKKSRIKRVVSAAEKVGLFAAGVYLGHKF